ncbi:MAG TPA: ATP-dependent DNA helicase RecQ [Gaiellales bacterium]|jgi:RecQ family ATP-dependent DNA helicase
MPTAVHDLTAELGRLFRFDEFRPGQLEAIEGTLAGRDVLAIMPTGSGKSLCYQLPALLGDGVTLVVSPLIALMQDQSAALRAAGHDGVEMIASIMTGEEVAAALRRIADGQASLVYVAPERFSSRKFLDAIGTAGVDRLAIDEAHCLSEWGHDFRPDFLRLADVRERLGSPPTMALTATATPRVARDIVQALGLRDPVMARTGFDRPNLFFEVVHVAGEAGKPRMLLAHLGDASRLPAVVYCGRRKTCEEVAAHLLGSGISAAPYHAGLPPAERTETLEAFLAGRLQAVAATTAFGMGIDKADVRSVVHWTIPSSPEEYYQQAGRAGRDGAPAVCTLLYSAADKGLIAYFIERAKLSEGQLEQVHGLLAGRADPSGLFSVSERDIPVDEPRIAVAVLERVGALELFPARNGTFTGRLAAPALNRAHRAAAMVAMRRQETVRWDRLKAIDRYAAGDRCRRAELLGYFGDTPAPRPDDICCDNHGGRPTSRLSVDERAAVLRAVDETHGSVGRTRLTQILRGGRARDLVAAGHHRLDSHAELAHRTEAHVLGLIDGLIDEGQLEKTGGRYPLVRRAAQAG